MSSRPETPPPERGPSPRHALALVTVGVALAAALVGSPTGAPRAAAAAEPTERATPAPPRTSASAPSPAERDPKARPRVVWRRQPGPAYFSALRADGGVDLLVDEVRLRVAADGSIAQGPDLLPDGVEFLAVPDRLGGGYVAARNPTGSICQLWRLDDWLAPARPLVAHPGTCRVRFASDRALQLGSRTAPLAFDLTTGATLADTRLPAAAAWDDLAALDGGLEVLLVPVLGALVTSDAGAHWRRLPVTAPRGLSAGEAAISVLSDGDGWIFRSDGTMARTSSGVVEPITPHTAAREAAVLEPVPPPLEPAGAARAELLARAAVDGVVASDGDAVLVYRGGLQRVSLDTVRVVEGPHAVAPADAACRGHRGAKAWHFLCQSPSAGTALATVPFGTLGWVPHASFVGRPRVRRAGPTGFIVDAACDGAPSASVVCALLDDGAARELPARADGLWTLDAEGHAVLFVPPGVSAGRLEREGRRGSTALRLKSADQEGSSSAASCRWLSDVRWYGEKLRAWCVSDGDLRGFEATARGEARLHSPGPSEDSALVDGERVLAVPPDGSPLESVDGGTTWIRVQAPVSARLAERGATNGCGANGCAVGRSWVRLGWRQSTAAPPLPVAAEPSLSAPKAGALTRASLTCRTERVVKVAGPPAALRRVPARAMASDEPPSVGPVNVVHPWGSSWLVPHGGDAWALEAEDSFGFEPRRWATRPAASPLADGRRIGALMSDGSGRAWYAMPTVAGHVALQAISSGEVLLYLGAAGAPLRVVSDTTALGGGAPRDAELLGGRWYVLQQGGLDARLLRVTGSALELVATYPLELSDSSESLAARLVVRSDGRGLGLLVTLPTAPPLRQRWVVHPIDPDGGDPSDAIVVSPHALSAIEPCSVDAVGYRVTAPLPIFPWLEAEGGEAIRARLSAARVLLGAHGACLEALAGSLPTAPVPPRGGERHLGEVSVTLAEGAERTELRCW